MADGFTSHKEGLQPHKPKSPISSIALEIFPGRDHQALYEFLEQLKRRYTTRYIQPQSTARFIRWEILRHGSKTNMLSTERQKARQIRTDGKSYRPSLHLEEVSHRTGLTNSLWISVSLVSSLIHEHSGKLYQLFLFAFATWSTNAARIFRPAADISISSIC